MLKTGIPWEMLPQEIGCGSGMTCWRGLKEWHEADVWNRLHKTLLNFLGKGTASTGQGRRWTRQACRLPGGEKIGPNPMYRRKRDSNFNEWVRLRRFRGACPP